ncbi:hypothetical protein ACQKM2_07250 [Streptomyces sp. NPDC004126]
MATPASSAQASPTGTLAPSHRERDTREILAWAAETGRTGGAGGSE